MVSVVPPLHWCHCSALPPTTLVVNKVPHSLVVSHEVPFCIVGLYKIPLLKGIITAEVPH